MTIEHRTFRNVEIRATDQRGPNGRPVVTLRAITPGVVDDYGSVWLPDTFDEAMQARIAADPDDTPALCWAHRWDDPIGHGIAYRATANGPDVDFEFDDFDAVPRAKQAEAQVRSKTIRDCSVGFFDVQRRDPTDEERQQYPGVTEIIEKADLDEVSLVLRGAVPGAKVLAMRSAQGDASLDADAFFEISRKVAAKEMSLEEGQAAIALLAVPDPAAPLGDVGDPPAELDHEALDAEIAETLAEREGL